MSGTRGYLPTRRAVLTAGAAAALMPVRIATAAGPADRPLILVLLRGMPDGQALVPSYGDPDYEAVRGALALPLPGAAGGILALDGKVGLNPALGALLPFWARGALHVAPAVAGPYIGGEIETARRVFDSGAPSADAVLGDGWLNRALAATGSAADGRTAAVVLGDTVPEVLSGAIPVAARDPFATGPFGPGFMAKAGTLYANDPALGQTMTAALNTAAAAQAGPDARGLSALAFTMAAGDLGRDLAAPGGPGVAVIEIGGWDTPRVQGAGSGPLSRRIVALGDGLAALADGLGARFAESAIVVLGAGGRSIAPNAVGGTDPGGAEAGFVLGSGLDLPGILGAPAALGADQRLPGGGAAPTLDVRALLKGVLARHWGLSRSALDKRIFPNSASVEPI